MLVFLNGSVAPEEEAVVSVFDRGFLYGDGLFETVRIFNGKPFRWEQHWERFERGAEFLKIRLPYSREELLGFADQLIVANQLPDSILRVTVSRGIGARGYSPRGADKPTLAMSLHPVPEQQSMERPAQWRLVYSTFRLPSNERISQFKTCNKLAQILARAEADSRGADEALLTNTDGYVVEASSSNLFWVSGDAICTSPLASGVLPGITRIVVFELARQLGMRVVEMNVRAADLRQVQGIFLSLSSLGIAEGHSLEGKALQRARMVTRLYEAYWELVRSEAGQVATCSGQSALR